MRNSLLSQIFEQMADIMEILGEDRFRINTYRKVGRIISDVPGDISSALSSGELAAAPGIGKSSIAKIEEFVKTGKITAHQQLLGKIPATLPALLHIPGVGPKGVKALYEQLNVKSIPEFKAAIDSGAVAQLPGFGDRKAEVIARGIEFLEKSTGRIRLDQAAEAAELVRQFLKSHSGVRKIQTAGSLRRRVETVGDVDILVAGDKGKEVVEAFTSAEFVQEVLAAGGTKGSAIIDAAGCGVHVDVRVVPEKSFGAAAQYFTGSKQHNVHLREIAVKSGLKLNEYGLFKAEKMLAGTVEADIYKKLKVDYIQPGLREDRGEIEAAKSHSLPELIRCKDIRGDLHVHTNASDGNCDIMQLVKAVKKPITSDLEDTIDGKWGPYKYICITDHSKSSAIANGLSAGRLARQIELIRKLNEQVKDIVILAGSEVDILADGSLDFDNKLLSELDFVIASIHSGLSSSREKVSMRTLKAMDNPYVNCIGHPTGRLIGQREPMDVDIAAVIKHAAQTHTALEVNANPYRLDLKDIHCRMAVEAGVKLTIATDAHSVENLGLMHYGVATAGRGWATADDVLNTYSAAKLKSWVAAKRKC
ncbi:MAG TPA: DNA polymerase/3'-5' exonuclease PolX [Sedimentisphaerales bacterium]|nr:DNA polymerase/3'-5' exonuclease PolX [Sedimentisphaerales bacterium]